MDLPTVTAAQANFEYVSLLRHALMTPLSGIVLWCDMLNRRANLSREELAKGLSRIERGARAQVAILDNLAELSRMQAGSTALSRSPVDLAECVDDVVSQNSSASQDRQVAVNFARPARALVVSGDPVRLRAALHNIVDNAVVAAPAGSQIDVMLETDGERFLIRISDQGTGIPADQVAEIFVVPELSEGGLARRRGGLGLGLPVARWIAGLHGGTIDLVANRPQGCVFTMALPVPVS